MPLISIITPSFNSEKTIERTIKSILTQKFQDFEYIIIDGGSTDSTCNIIKYYEPLFKGRLYWKSEADKGIYDAFNKGIKASTGKYIWIVNSDDWIEPDALTIISNIIYSLNTEKEYPIISGAMNFCSRDGSLKKKFLSNISQAKHCFETDSMGVIHPATIVPKMIYNKYGMYDDKFRIIGDIDWFHRIYAKNVPLLFINDVITNMSDGGISNLLSYKKSAKDRWRFICKKHQNHIVKYIWFIRWSIYFYKLKIKKKAIENV